MKNKSVREKLEMSTIFTTLKKHPANKKGQTFSNNLKHFQMNVNHYLIPELVTKTDRKHKRNFGISKKLAWKKNSPMVNAKSHR